MEDKMATLSKRHQEYLNDPILHSFHKKLAIVYSLANTEGYPNAHGGITFQLSEADQLWIDKIEQQKEEWRVKAYPDLFKTEEKSWK